MITCKRFFLSASFFSTLLIQILFFPQSAFGQDQVISTHKITLGSYLSIGDYGADEDTRIDYFPITYELGRFPWVLSLTVPLIGLKGPGDVFLETGNVGRGQGETAEIIDEQGLGDVFVSASYQLEPLFNGWVFLDLTLQAKLPTADESKDLGTGEADYGLQVDLYSTLEKNTYFTTFGYRQRGKTPLYDLENSYYATLGYMRQIQEDTFLGLLYDYREKASSNSFESHEIMPFISYNLDKSWNMMFYTILGFTDSSADKTLGFQLSYTFP